MSKTGRKRRGRKSKAQKAQRQRRGPTAKEKSKFIFKHRFLIVKRREDFSATDKRNLRQMQQYLPELATLREFVDRVYRLLSLEQSEHQAWCRRAVLLKEKAYAAIPELQQALDMLVADKFRKMIAFLRSPAAKRVRTNNHVERTNRKIRFWEKVRYKWRRRRTLVQFIVLALDHWWKRIRQLPAKVHTTKKTGRQNVRKTASRKTSKTNAKPDREAA